MHAPAPSMDGVFPLPSPRDSAPEAAPPAPRDDLSSNEQGDAPAAEAAPKAEMAKRWLVTGHGVRSKVAPRVNRMKARSPASPGSGRYQAGRSTAAGSIFSMSITVSPSAASITRLSPLPPPRTRTRLEC